MNAAAVAQSRHVRFLKPRPVAMGAAPGLARTGRESAAAASPRIEESEACVRQYTPLVTRIARNVLRTMPRSVELDDAIQLGMMGLLEALRRYQRRNGANFLTYAAIRIRGAILDGLRRNDVAPRRLRAATRNIKAATSTLEQRLQRPPRDAEVAAYLGCTLAQYHSTLRRASECEQVRWEGAGDEPGCDAAIVHESADPLEQLIAASTADELRSAIAQLPERERNLVDLYYWKNAKLRQIGKLLGVSESRICQMLKRGVEALRAQLAPRASAAG